MSFPHNSGIQYTELIEITPSDSIEIVVRALKVTDDTSGNAVAIQTKGMAAAVTDYFVLGQVYPVGGKAIKVMLTGTTADTIIGYR